MKDHLGNTRVLMDGSGKVLQEFAYYPFGMQIEELAFLDATMQNPFEYSYNGKEEWGEFGLGYYDYHNRGYDAEKIRWDVQDPLQEQFYAWSNYNYALNNPMRFIDPDGRRPEGIQNKRKKANIRYSGSPVSVSGSLKGKILGGELSYKSPSSELKLKGAIGLAKISSDGESMKGSVELLAGQATLKAGVIEVSEKVSVAKGSMELTENGLENGKYSVGNLEAKLDANGIGGSLSSSITSSEGGNNSNATVKQGDNSVSTNGDKTTLTVGAGPANVGLTVDHQKSANFITDIFNIIGNAIFGKEVERINNGINNENK